MGLSVISSGSNLIDSGSNYLTFRPLMDQPAPENYSSNISQIVNGDWYIDGDDEVSMDNKTIILNGDLMINSSGLLSLDNITLILNNTASRSIDIIIRPNGFLKVKNSVIMAKSAQSCARIVFETSSKGMITESNIIGLGAKTSNSSLLDPYFSAIIIRSDKVEVSGAIIENSEHGIYLENCCPKLKDIQVLNSEYGIVGNNTLCEISNCSLNCVQMDIILINMSNVTLIDSKMFTKDLDLNSRLLIKDLLSIRVNFQTPFLKPIKNADVMVNTSGLPVYCTPGFGGNHSTTDALGKIEPIPVARTFFCGNNVTRFHTQIVVRYNSRKDLQRDVVLNGSRYELFYFSNNLPRLNQPMVSPWSGDIESVFSFKVNYSDLDNDKPDKVQVQIDNNIFNMTTIKHLDNVDKIDWRMGVWFQYNTTLPANEHKFRFITNEGFDFQDIYAPTGKIEFLDGPVVDLVNSDPILSLGSVTPTSGNPNTIFNFQVKYWDFEGDAAANAKVYIDNIPYKMQPDMKETKIQISTTGIWYKLKTKLPVGNHNFFFKFNDNNNSDITFWPTVDDGYAKIDGPVVNPFKNKKPFIGNGTVTPGIGHRLILYSYTISYFDPEGDLPTLAQVVIDGEAKNLTMARIAQNIYFYETYLPLGEHYYHFRFWDELNQHFIRFPAEIGTDIVGPIVLDLPPTLKDGLVTPIKGNSETVFNFSIVYEDLENDLPMEAKIVIDNQSFNLTSSPPKILKYSTKLELGNHSHYFLIKSGNFIIRYPSAGFLTGPIVTNNYGKDNNDSDVEGDNINESTDKNEDNDEKDGQKEDGGTTEDDDENPEDVSNNSEPKLSDLYLIILNYSANNIENFPNNVFKFIIVCKVSENLNYKYSCKLFVDDVSCEMSSSKNLQKKIITFEIVLELSGGEHYYHFLIKNDGINIRSPYRGELRIIVEDESANHDNDTEQFFIGNITNEQRNNIVKIMFLILLVLSVIYFSFYRKYQDLKRRDKNH